MSSVRLRRLQADYQNLVEYIRRHPRLRLIQATGNPPEQYQIEYCIKSVRQVGTELQESKSHLVEISLPRNYPRTPPFCRMLTPVFHPNIAPHAICVGDHWSAGEPLMSIVARIGEMLAFQSYNVKSPLNGEAARWVEQNLDKLPLDAVSLLVEESGQVEAPQPNETSAPESVTDFVEPDAPPSAMPSSPATVAASTQSTSPTDAVEIVFEEEPQKPMFITAICPSCSTEFRVPPDYVGRKARCSRCRRVFVVLEN